MHRYLRDSTLAMSLLYASVSAAQVCHSPTPAMGAAQTGGVQIPVSIQGGGVFVTIVMNDGQNYSFLLDSGFEDSVLDTATIRALHLISRDMHTEAAPGGKVETSSVIGVHRSIGGLAIANSTLSSFDLSSFAPLFGHHLDGVLGYDFFQQFVVILDYQHRRLTLCDPASFQGARGRSLPISLESRQPYIETEIEGPSGKLIQASLEVDTGKVDPFSVSAAFARRTGLLADAKGLLAMKGVSVGGETQAWMTRTQELRFGGLLIKNPLMGIAEEDADRAGQIGYGVLKRFTVTFDYTRKKAFFEPNDSFDQPYEFDHAGFVLGAGGADFSTLTVFMVIAGTPAATAGVQNGDEILTINGRPASAFTLEGAREHFEHAEGSQKLTIRRNGSVVSLILECHSIV